MAKKYRKRPVVIEAMKLTEKTPFADIVEFIGHGVEVGSAYVLIHTLDGDMMARMGDYIIKEVQGEFYPCKSDIFEATYEEV